MNLLQDLLSGKGEAALSALGAEFGLSGDDTTKAVTALVPALAQGLKENATEAGGLQSLLKALQSGSHDQYLDNPATLTSPATKADGENILGHIFGTPEASKALTAKAAEKTGLGQDVLAQMLPFVASMVMGSLSKKVGGQDLSGMLGGLLGGGKSGGGDLGPLAGMLDVDGDGDITGEVLGLAKSFFKR